MRDSLGGMHPSIPKTVNLAVELRSGRHYGVFIDDTGSPGLATPGLNAQRKSWVAVIVPPHQAAEVMDQVPGALSALRELGVHDPELHFTDIWAGERQFETLSLPQRLGVFRFMANVFETYRFSVLVQTFDPENAANIRSGAKWPETMGPLKSSDHEDLALIVLLMRVRLHLKSLEGSATACVLIDEGRLPSGRSITLPGLAPTFVAGSVLFANSRLVHPIQLADFAAFALNRWQLLRVKSELSELDKTFLEIMSPVASNFVNIENIPLILTPKT